jgi:anthranilate synthase component 1
MEELMMQVKSSEQTVLFKSIHGEKFTPFSLCRKLNARVLLESAAFGSGKGRYSILLIRKAFSLFQKGERILMERDGRVHALKTKSMDILEVLLYFAQQHRNGEHHFPLPAGGIGYLTYEYALHFDDFKFRKKSDTIGIPDAFFIFGHSFLIFDHYTDQINIVALNYREHRINLEKEIQDIEERIHDLDFNYLNPGSESCTCVPLVKEQEREIFLKGVDRVRKEIIKGNLLQGVLSRRLLLRTEIPALEAYRKLRSINPSPYMFYLNLGKFQLFGSSPELHVKYDGKKVLMRPIAGTRRRGLNREEDLSLERELLADQKEQAEHLMLVDLARNDLGRICEPGSVRVSEFMSVERYSHVMHIVSQVEGTLREDLNGIASIRYTFPAGTVSGAPKIKAVEVIDSLESVTRSFYAGIVGYIEPGGTLDSCITIRSALKMDDLLILQAGAGIVYDSVPEREYEETSSKLRALGNSIGVEV